LRIKMIEELTTKSEDRIFSIPDPDKSSMHNDKSTIQRRIKLLLKDKRFSGMERLEVLATSPTASLYVLHKTNKATTLYIWQEDKFEEANVVSCAGTGNADQIIEFELHGLRGDIYIPASWRKDKTPESTYQGSTQPLIKVDIFLNYI
jgi:hypothetical protein